MEMSIFMVFQWFSLANHLVEHFQAFQVCMMEHLSDLMSTTNANYLLILVIIKNEIMILTVDQYIECTTRKESNYQTFKFIPIIDS